MDNELYKLCKEVYERTGWDEVYLGKHLTPEAEGASKHGYTMFIAADGRRTSFLEAHSYDNGIFGAPEYTSDYLLDKLPFPSELGRDSFAWIGQWEQGAGSADKRQIWERADTPLKALLKLTIALHEAKELTNDR